MIRVLIADDHAIVRGGFRQFVADEPDMCVAAEASTGDETIRLVREQLTGEPFDVVLLDIAMPDEIVRAIRSVARGHRYLSEAVADTLANSLDKPAATNPHEQLSEREFQIFCKLASGQIPTDIAGELHLSVKTVSTYRARVLEKMHMTNNADMTYYAIKNGLIE